MCSVVSEYGMPYCLRLLHADIFPQKLSRRCGDAHFGGRVWRGLNQHGNIEARQAQRIGDGALVAKIGQSDDDAVDSARVFGTEQLGAAFGFFVSFHGAVFAVSRAPSATTS